MTQKTGKNRTGEMLWGLLGAVVMLIVLSFFFDYYYDLNDDVLIKDIISGAYTGAPDGHNIQMLYPLGFFLSLPYYVFPQIPWFALFELDCMGLVYAVFYCGIQRLTEKKAGKRALAFILMIPFAGIYLWELVMVQYTVVCGALAAAAAFWLYLTPDCEKAGDFWKHNVLSIVLVILAFNMRTEMLLLMGPFIGAVGLLKWAKEEKPFVVLAWKKYMGTVGFILAGMVVSVLVNKVAYSSTEWKNFITFFDNRTEVYDFTGIPDYNTHQAFYDSIEISDEEYTLLVNYNFGLSEEINADALGKIAEYAGTHVKAGGFSFGGLVQATKDSFEGLFDVHAPWTNDNYEASPFTETNLSDAPFNILVILCYIMVVITAWINRDKSYLWKLPLMFLARSISWIFILYRGRIVDRITHPLYFMEIFMLVGVLLVEYRKTSAKKIMSAGFLLLFVVTLLYIPQNVTKTMTKQTVRENVNWLNEEFFAYTRENPENYYIVDVYSTVQYTEKMFTHPIDKANQQLMGGWACKSPLDNKKNVFFGFDINSMSVALLEKENVYFVSDAVYDTSWLANYYSQEGIDINIQISEILGLEEAPAVERGHTMFVYKLQKN